MALKSSSPVGANTEAGGVFSETAPGDTLFLIGSVVGNGGRFHLAGEEAYGTHSGEAGGQLVHLRPSSSYRRPPRFHQPNK